MKVLVDTHIALWALFDQEKLPDTARGILQDMPDPVISITPRGNRVSRPSRSSSRRTINTTLPDISDLVEPWVSEHAPTDTCGHACDEADLMDELYEEEESYWYE